ncbi:MAG: hypothetical protein IJM18_01205 [Clostridia bacterium]|nr:hypothetical protein [Clostridia bacterium]
MQRVPSRSIPKHYSGVREENASPLLLLARRIREEQGPEQVKAFIGAMAPFAAPNELKRISEGFGIEYETIDRPLARRPEQPQPARDSNGGQMQMLQTLIQLSGVMRNGGADPAKLISLLSGR